MNPDNIVRSRIGNACDGCKARKVKCDGKLPCSYCARHQRAHACHYSPQRRRTRRNAQPPRSSLSGSDGDARSRRSASAITSNMSSSLSHGHNSNRDSHNPSHNGNLNHNTNATMNNTNDPNVNAHANSTLNHTSNHNLNPNINSTLNYTNNPNLNPNVDHPMDNASTPATAIRPGSSGDAANEDDTEVPREARLLCDAQGKLIFIGDCAPLSFFQSVRQLVTTKVGQNAFAPHSSRYSVLENAPARPSNQVSRVGMPNVTGIDIPSVVSTYLATTAGLINLYDGRLVDDLMLWANSVEKPDDATTIANLLVLAIGSHVVDEDLAQDCFEYARDRAFVNLSGNLSVGTVQVFLLITVYMLCSCQINGAFLFFGISVRAAYSIGIHRTEVNARFGHEIRRQRDRLWKSLRVVDLFLSTSMGRPPATSDVDCTVPYQAVDESGNEVFDLLNSSVQIFLILESVVTEIYSRKKISLQLTEGISLQLRDWSIRWLRRLKDVVASEQIQDRAQVAGACQILSTYYYAVMLVSRPFLMYELCRRLSDPVPPASNSSRSTSLPSGKSKLADACIDAASLMVDPILDLVDRGVLVDRFPLLVSWLFAASLVLGVGLLGGFGRILEKYTKMSIQALDHFSKHDAHATQYSLIAQSLLTTALEYLEKRELQERLRRTESSSQLFGLIPRDNGPGAGASTPASTRDINTHVSSPIGGNPNGRMRESLERSFLQHNGLHNLGSPPRFSDLDSAFLGLSESLLQTPDSNYWNGTFGADDPGSALNLFALLDAGGGIDLAHHL